MKRALPILFVITSACSKKDEPAKAPPPPEKTDKGEQKPPPEPPPPAQPQVIKLEGFKTPESVLWDDQAKVFLVSNIDGNPGDKDDNGFIARVSPLPDAKVVDAAWIDGKKPDITLSAPKGMAFLGDVLYVTDVDAVRTFDRKTGAPKGDIAIPGAVFLNDIVAGDGVVYVSDSGVDKDFKPGPAQAIWEIRDGKPKQLAKGEELGAPNGLAIVDGELWVNTFASGEIYKLKDGKRENVEKLPKGQLDGMRVVDGTWYVSSWEGSTVFHGKPGQWTQGAPIPSPADFEVDPGNHVMIVPVFMENRVEMHELPRK